MLYFPKEIYNEIINHAKESYPHEACGALVGEQKSNLREQESEASKNIVHSCRMENTNKDRANDRYEINPKELLKIEKEASSNGLEVIGFYHSHPDHPDRPSVFDREMAWPWYSDTYYWTKKLFHKKACMRKIPISYLRAKLIQHIQHNIFN